MQIWIQSRLKSRDYVLGAEVTAVGKLYAWAQIQSNAAAVPLDRPTLRLFWLILLRFAIHANQHSASEIANYVRRIVLRHQWVEGLGIGFDCDAKLAAVLARTTACRQI